MLELKEGTLPKYMDPEERHGRHHRFLSNNLREKAYMLYTLKDATLS